MKFALFDELLVKKMTRRQFLVHIGLLVIAVSGIGGILKVLSDPHLSRHHYKVQANGFGAGPYGGVKKG